MSEAEVYTRERVIKEYGSEDEFFAWHWPYEFAFDLEVESIMDRIISGVKETYSFDKWLAGYYFCQIAPEDLTYAINEIRQSFLENSWYDEAADIIRLWGELVEELVISFRVKSDLRDDDYMVLSDLLGLVSPTDLYAGIKVATWNDDFMRATVEESYAKVIYDGEVYYTEF